MEDLYRAPVSGGDRLKAGLALQMVAAATGVPVEHISGHARRSGQACRARWLAMYVARDLVSECGQHASGVGS